MRADAANLLAGGVGALPAKTLKIDVPKFAIIWYLETNPSSAGGLVTVKSVCVCVCVCRCVCMYLEVGTYVSQRTLEPRT